MQLRRLRSHRLSLLAAGTLLASPLLAGCGFNYATDRVNTVSAGISDRSGSVDVLGAVVIAGEDDAGLFVATLVNKDPEPVELNGIQPTDGVQAIGTEEPLTIDPGEHQSLFKTGGLAISGTFKAGDFLPVTLTFSNGQVTTVEVSVVPPCHQYSLDKLTDLTLPSATPAIDPGNGAEATATPEADTTEESTAAAEEGSADEEFGPYSCESIPAVEHHAEGEGAEGGSEGAEGEGAE